MATRRKKHQRNRTLSDTEAMDRIKALMDGDEWDSDTTSAISEIVLATGREIHDSNATEDDSDDQ